MTLLTMLVLAQALTPVQHLQHTQDALQAQPLARFATSSGAGLTTTVPELCVTAYTHFTGGWWCLNGDGTTYAGSSLTFSEVGTLTANQRRICPNGPDCTAVSVKSNYGDAASYFQGSVSTTASNDFTACALFRHGEVANTGDNIFSMGQGGILSSYRMHFNSSTSALGMQVCSTSTTCVSGATAAGAAPPYVWNLACIGVAGGASVVRKIWVNGVLAHTGTTGPGYAFQAKPSTFQVGVGIRGDFRGAFFTYKIMSDAEMTALSNAVFGYTPTGTKGEATTYTNSATQPCVVSDGSFDVVQSGKPCVTQNSLQMYSPTTNYNPNSNAAWSTFSLGVSVPTVTAFYEHGPENLKIAYRYQVPAVSTAGHYSIAQLSAVGSAGVFSSAAKMSAYFKGTSGSGSATIAYYCTGATGTVQHTQCQFTADSWSRCSLDGPLCGGTVVLQIGNVQAYTGTTPAWDALVTGVQMEPSKILHPLIPTYGAAVATSAPSFYMTLPSPVGGSAFSTAMTLATPNTVSGPKRNYLSGWTSALDSMTLLTDNGAVTVKGYVNTATVTGGNVASTTTVKFKQAGGTQTIKVNGATVSAVGGSPTATSTWYIGSDGAGSGYAEGLVKDVCIDTKGACFR